MKNPDNMGMGEAAQLETSDVIDLANSQAKLDALIVKQRDLEKEIDAGWADLKQNIGVTPEEHLEKLWTIRTKMRVYDLGQQEKMDLIENINKLRQERVGALNAKFEPAALAEPTYLEHGANESIDKIKQNVDAFNAKYPTKDQYREAVEEAQQL